jgi:hypothetical protein
MADLQRIVQRFLIAAKPKPVLYLGLILDEASLSRLLAWWNTTVGEELLGKYTAHHVTIQFKPTVDQVAHADVGSRHSVRVVGWASDEKAQAVVVQGIEVAQGQTPHVTLAVAPGVPPAHSKELVQKLTRTPGPTLTGTVEAVMGN